MKQYIVQIKEIKSGNQKGQSNGIYLGTFIQCSEKEINTAEIPSIVS